jgi:hypothetical protein
MWKHRGKVYNGNVKQHICMQLMFGFLYYIFITLNDCELCVGKDMERDSHGLFQGIMLEHKCRMS